jgi:putative FmdB family regulatory protein
MKKDSLPLEGGGAGWGFFRGLFYGFRGEFLRFLYFLRPSALICVLSWGGFMPIFEYECHQCRAISTFLILKKEDKARVACKGCGSEKMSIIISRVTYHRSESDRLSEFDSRKPQGEEFYKDSRNIGLWAKKRAKEMGVDLGPKFDEIQESARTGKILEKYDL